MTGKKIFLIGMPGSGKSHLGVLLAQDLSLPFIDLDDVIIKKTGTSIADYFATFGEDQFREVEKVALVETIKNRQDFVMATGGGAPCFFDNLQEMKDAGMTIFLNMDKEVLFERNVASTERPLMQGDVKNKIAGLLKNRLLIYQKAHLTISTANSRDLAAEITQFFKS